MASIGLVRLPVEANGKRRRKYPLADYATAYERLRSHRKGRVVLRPGLSGEALKRIAKSAGDTEFTDCMRCAKSELLRKCKMESPLPPRMGAFRDRAPVVDRPWLGRSHSELIYFLEIYMPTPDCIAGGGRWWPS